MAPTDHDDAADLNEALLRIRTNFDRKLELKLNSRTIFEEHSPQQVRPGVVRPDVRRELGFFATIWSRFFN